MFVVVDANIVFSALLNTQSRIGQMLLNAPETSLSSLPTSCLLSCIVITGKSAASLG